MEMCFSKENPPKKATKPSCLGARIMLYSITTPYPLLSKPSGPKTTDSSIDQPRALCTMPKRSATQPISHLISHLSKTSISLIVYIPAYCFLEPRCVTSEGRRERQSEGSCPMPFRSSVVESAVYAVIGII